MTIGEKHNKMVAGLAKPGATILEQSTAELCHMLHMTMGLVGEAIEVHNHITHPPKEFETDYRTDLLLELGDISFYLVGLLQSMGTTLDAQILKGRDESNYNDKYLDSLMARDEDNYVVTVAPGDLVRYAGYISEAVKKHWIYGKPLPDDFNNWFNNIIVLIDEISMNEGSSLEEVLQMNIDKLGARYKGFDYSDEAAIAKADAQKPEAAAVS